MTKTERLMVRASVVLMVVALLALALSIFSVAKAQPSHRAALICNSGPAADIARPTKHPRRCMILRPYASFSEGVNLAKLRWQHWGKRHATFRGISKGFHLPPLRLPVRGYAYRLRRDRCGGGLLLYTRVRVKWEGRAYTMKPLDCYGND